jgi:protease-4
MNQRSSFRWFLRTAGLILLVVILPLVLGYLLSLYLMPTPQVAVIRIEGDIWGFYADQISLALEEAGRDPAVRAVVLEITSPGGEVSASENLYFDVLNLREKVPVVASVKEIATSGAYYVASAADQIYVKGASVVGNIGAIAVLPDPDLVDETLVTTGPFKFSGGSQVDHIRRMEMLKDAFLEAIYAQRVDRLTVGREVLSRGETFLGLQAQQMGLIDEIGSQGEAVAAAAHLARIRHYQVVDRTPELPEEFTLLGLELSGRSRLPAIVTAFSRSAAPDDLPPGFYYRTVEPPR